MMWLRKSESKQERSEEEEKNILDTYKEKYMIFLE